MAVMLKMYCTIHLYYFTYKVVFLLHYSVCIFFKYCGVTTRVFSVLCLFSSAEYPAKMSASPEPETKIEKSEPKSASKSSKKSRKRSESRSRRLVLADFFVFGTRQVYHISVHCTYRKVCIEGSEGYCTNLRVRQSSALKYFK